MSAFNPHGLSSLLWGFAKLNWEPGTAFLAASEEAALTSLSSYAPRELSGLLLAYCRMGHNPGVSSPVNMLQPSTTSPHNSPPPLLTTHKIYTLV